MRISSHRPALHTICIILLFAGLLAAGFTGLAAAAPPAQSADEGKAIFQTKCAACHTISGGPLVGPDLKGVTAQRDRAWLERWLSAPDKMLAEGDPIATQLLHQYNNVPMPNLGLNQTEVQALIAYLDSQSGAAGPAPTASAPAPQAAAGNPQQGEAFFTGGVHLLNGGPPCMSCHSITGIGALGGGTLGPNLTLAFTKYGGDAGMAAALAGLPFPTMMPIFGTRPLSPEEQADLLAFLRAADQAAGGVPPASAGWPVAGLAAGGLVLFLGISQVIWRRRLRGVRRFLVREKGKAQ